MVYQESESESRIKQKVQKCADMDYNLCSEITNHLPDDQSREAKEFTVEQIMKQEQVYEESTILMVNSSSGQHDNEELDDLLQRYYSKPSGNVTTHDTAVDGEALRDSPGRPYNCLLCNEIFNELRELEQHIQSVHLNDQECPSSTDLKQHKKAAKCNDDQHLCYECNKTFAHKYSLRTHLNAVHGGLKPHSCMHCGHAFAKKANLVRHMKALHADSMKSDDQVLTSCNPRISMHDFHSTTTRTFEANIDDQGMLGEFREQDSTHSMDQSYKYDDDLSGECKSEVRIKCEVEDCADTNCNASNEKSQYGKFSIEENFSGEKYQCEKITHEENSSGEISPKYFGHPLQHFAATECSEKMTEDDPVEQNVKRECLSDESGSSSDDDSNSEVSDGEEFDELLQKSHSTSTGHQLAGVTSGRVSSNKSDPARRDKCSQCKKTFSRIDQVKRCTQCKHLTDVQLHCTQCDKIFSTAQCLNQHIQRKHMNHRQHCCTQCDKAFSIEPDLTQHIKHVHGNVKYECDKCDYSTVNIYSLNKHISAVHLQKKPHKCPQCEFRFSWKSKLAEHIRVVHNHDKPFECSACDKKFSSGPMLNRHWRAVHSGEKPYSCDQCDFKFSDKGYLTKHVRSVHDGIHRELKRFSCAQCEYKTSKNSNLRRHQIDVHSQQKLHSCTECDKSFSQASTLKSHVDTIHRGLKPHTCAECASSFSRKTDLQNHIKAVHRKEKPHSCSVCRKTFSHVSALYQHMKGVHKHQSFNEDI